MKSRVLVKKQFKNFIGSIYHFHRFSKNGKDYELCFEPCDYGFCVAVYERFGQKPYQLVINKQCVSEAGYQNDPFHQMERRPGTWSKAIQIAEELITRL